MEVVIKHFDELNTDELHEIYQLRGSVFVVEQNSTLQEVDENDKVAYHVFLKDEEGIAAYLRVFMKDEESGLATLGRVLSVKRGEGLGSQVVSEGVKVAKNLLNAKAMEIDAQTYAIELYEKEGFKVISDEYFLEDISHTKMRLEF